MARAINGTEKQGKLFNQSYKASSYLRPRGRTHTRMHAYLHESDFKKPGAC